ncbi:MAG: hypothetical protein J7K36_08130 [Archaeoglobaceae archaeon]|nr:hypothetical protein [Archaeoglobaceae archaeon]
MSKSKENQNNTSPDIVREDLLNFLYQKYKKSRSVKKQAATISEIKKALKQKGHKEQEIVGAISFLIDRGWIKEEKEKTKFFIKDKLTEGEKITYRISDIGIVHFEGPSKFISQNKFSGINITNISGVTVVGNNNIVRNEYLDLFNYLDELAEVLRSSATLTDEEKADLQSDIETIKSQLGKQNPNRKVISLIWDNLKGIVSKVPEAADKIAKVASLIKIFMG